MVPVFVSSEEGASASPAADCIRALTTVAIVAAAVVVAAAAAAAVADIAVVAAKASSGGATVRGDSMLSVLLALGIALSSCV